MTKIFLLKGINGNIVADNDDLKTLLFNMVMALNTDYFELDSDFLVKEFGVSPSEEGVRVYRIDVPIGGEIAVASVLKDLEDLGVLNNDNNAFFVDE